MKVKLLILIEPAPYVLDFIKVLGADNRKDIMIFFARRRQSQPWRNYETNPSCISFLPRNRLRAMLLLWRLIRQEKTELLHVAGWHGFVMLFSWAVARIKKVPLFVELDSSLRNGQSGFKNRVKNKIYPHLYSIPTCFLPAGKKGRDYLMDYGVDKSRIVVHQMTVDVLSTIKNIDRFRGDVTAKNNHHICRFLFVGRLIKRKGLSQLLKAFSLVIAQNNLCQLTIVGDGECKSDVLSAAQDNKNITYCGHLDGAALLQQYAFSDVFVFPAYDEPWGLVINEAMAASLPVIVGESVGCAEDLVKHGINGFLIPTNDYLNLSDTMLKLADNSDLREKMGQSSRQMIMSWTMENQVRVIEETWAKYTAASITQD